MDRSSFGQWGLELDEADFARALAALGVVRQWIGELQGVENVPVENVVRALVILYADIAARERAPLRHFIDPRAVYDREGNIIPARVFADAWKALPENFREDLDDHRTPREKSGVRLEIAPTDADFLWLVEQLSNLDAVGAASVYVRSDEPAAPVGWDWPIRVGFMPGEPSRALREELESLARRERHWLGPLVEFVTLGEGADSCDLLLMPSDLRGAVSAVLGARAPVRADCVMVLGGARERSANVTLLGMTLRSSAKTAGVGLVRVAPERHADWFSNLIRELSHDETIDVALYRASRGEPASAAPLLVASRRLIDFTRISGNIKALGEQLRAAAEARRTVDLGYEGYGLGIPSGGHAAHELADMLEANAANFGFDSERKAATSYVRLREGARRVLAEAPRPEPALRWIQAQVFEARTEGEPVRVRRALRAGARHVASVRVGRESAEWESPPEEFTFPSRELPPDREEHELTVVFSEPQLLPEPMTATITLPRDGDSTVCRFPFYAREGVKEMEARVTVLHRNRVLQTAMLRAAVRPEPEEAPDDYRVRLDPETMPRAQMAGLGSRREFDAAFVLNLDTSNEHGFMAVGGRRAFFRSPSGLKEFNDLLDGALADISASPGKYAGGLRGDATVELLRTFARQGSQLYEDIVLDRISDDFISGAGRIQVVSADPETRLPIEFCYDRAAPGKHAGLCPHAGEVLEGNSNECRADCPGKSSPRDYVCPLGFWGLTKVIERHMHGKGPDAEAQGRDFGVQAEPMGDRNRLDVLRGVLVAASDNAGNYEPEPAAAAGSKGVDAVLDEVRRFWASASDPAKTWQEWLERIESERPTTLILLTHTVKQAGDPIAALAICDGKLDGVKLELVDVSPGHLRNPKENPEPLVMLIGCETGAADINFFNFVSKFRRNGAAVVISTGVKVRGRHAVPITRELVSLLGEYAGREATSFGDVMLAARRRMLARGIPAVLTLLAFGDADWQIGLPKH